jgi:multidrug efflux system membrane fusion protein
MKPVWKVIAVGGIAVAVAGWRIAAVLTAPAGSDERDQAIPVSVEKVGAHDVPITSVGIGTVQAFNTVTIRARVDGELVKVAYKEGQDVKKGDLLAQIDPRPYQAALDFALANLAKDRAMQANARRDFGRYRDTAEKGYSSRQQLDTQTAAVDAATATVEADEATVENARVQLGYTSIVSPLDGVTGIRLIDQGNIVHATDANGLVVITQVRPIAVIFTLPQAMLPQVVAAQAKGPVAVTALDADGAAEIGAGNLELIDNQIDPTTGTIRLKASFANENRALWPGEFVNIRLQTDVIHNGLTVSSRAVQRGPKGFFVFVVKPDRTVEPRPVTVGAEDRGRMLIAGGLATGETVVVDGQLRLRAGAAVTLSGDKTAVTERPGGSSP